LIDNRIMIAHYKNEGNLMLHIRLDELIDVVDQATKSSKMLTGFDKVETNGSSLHMHTCLNMFVRTIIVRGYIHV